MIRDYENLEDVPLDKLYKLRDVARDNCIDLHIEYMNSRDRVIAIEKEISLRYKNKVREM